MSYSEDLIGYWVFRKGSKAHYVESVVNGQLVTNCGRRLRRDGYRMIDLFDPWNIECRQCGPVGSS